MNFVPSLHVLSAKGSKNEVHFSTFATPKAPKKFENFFEILEKFVSYDAIESVFRGILSISISNLSYLFALAVTCCANNILYPKSYFWLSLYLLNPITVHPLFILRGVDFTNKFEH